MKRQSRIRSVLVILLLLAASGASARKTVTLSNGSWPPLLCRTGTGGGPLTQVVTRAFAREGYTAKYTFLPWNRSYRMAARGRFDGSVGWGKTPGRERVFDFSHPMLTVKKVFFHLKSFDFQWQSIRDLQGLRVGMTTHYTYGRAFDSAVRRGLLNIDPVTDDRLNIRKLVAGRIDVFPMTRVVGEYWIRRLLTPHQAARITFDPKPLTKTALALAISKRIDPARAKRLIRAFNQGLSKMRADGSLSKHLSAVIKSNTCQE